MVARLFLFFHVSVSPSLIIINPFFCAFIWNTVITIMIASSTTTMVETEALVILNKGILIE